MRRLPFCAGCVLRSGRRAVGMCIGVRAGDTVQTLLQTAPTLPPHSSAGDKVYILLHGSVVITKGALTLATFRAGGVRGESEDEG